ncbi:MAG: ribose ABC transporter [Rhodobacteraceae bacterium]|nr:ribose ABC transporter [Paracoccaceae bacterium]
MLIGLDGRLTPELLYALASMGHGDCLTIVDANYPAVTAAKHTVWGQVVDFGGDSTQALQAILGVLPLDNFDPQTPPARAMQMVDTPETLAEAVRDAVPLIRAAGQDIAMVERFAFYAAAQTSFVIIRTTERRFYGNFILRKGVVSS